MHPLYGIYLADQLAIADPEERIMALESVLDVPGRWPSWLAYPATIACLRDARQTAAGQSVVAIGFGHTCGAGSPLEEEEEEVRDRGFGRVMFDEPRVWPLTLPEKIYRLFKADYPSVHDVNVRPGGSWVSCGSSISTSISM